MKIISSISVQLVDSLDRRLVEPVQLSVCLSLIVFRLLLASSSSNYLASSCTTNNTSIPSPTALYAYYILTNPRDRRLRMKANSTPIYFICYYADD